MSSPSRRESAALTSAALNNAAIIAQLLDDPARFHFLQAVRLLQRAGHSRVTSAQHKPLEIAQYTPPEKEIIRFCSDPQLSFAASEITAITLSKHKNQQEQLRQWQMTVAFMGLSGTSGVLPYHYSETILQQLKNKNYSLIDFLELFNHRTISLFYRASTKYKLPIQYEKSKLGILKNTRDDFSQSLLSVIGLGTRQLNNQLHTDDEALLRYSGLFSQSVRTSSGLKRMLSEHFGYRFTIDEFRGQWQELLPDLTTRLTSREQRRGCNACLGKNAKLGSRGWFMQGRIVVNIGPLNLSQFESLAPGSRKLAAINEMVRLYIGIEQDYEINITLNRSDVSKPLQLTKGNRPILGWNSWFGNSKPAHPKQNAINVRLSAAS